MINFLFSVLLISALTIMSAEATPVDWLPVDNAQKTRVADPVFGGEMTVYEAGPPAGETVVLVHGIGPGARDWSRVMTSLAADYRVIAIDLPGFGESSKGNHLYGPEQLAVAVHGALAGRSEQPFSLVGYSLGAAVSLAYAHLYPEDLNRLVLADMPGVLHRTVYTRFLGDQGAAVFDGEDGLGVGAWVSGLLGTQLEQLEANGFNPQVLLYSPTARQYVLGGQPSMIAAYAAAEHNFGDALRDLRVPLLVLWGEDDAVTPLRTGQILASVVPGARLKIFPEMGHMLPMQAPDAMVAALRAELSGRAAALPSYTQTLESSEAARSARCNSQAGRRFTGRISTLVLDNCSNVIIENAAIDDLQIIGGDVEIINSEIANGINARNTRLKITAGSVSGEPPLTLEDTNVDAAATRFLSEFDVADNVGGTPVTLSFSVASQVNPQGHTRQLHEIVRLPGSAVWP